MKKDKFSEDINFSIILPSYNLSDYIKGAIESVLSQSYPYWELIIVDDASTDDSIQSIKPFLKDPRIKLFIHDNNKGVGQTVITAINNASNMILAILDSDDMLHQKALQYMAKAYQENPECGLIYSTHWICNKDLKILKIADWVGSVNSNTSNLRDFKVSHFKTFRKDIYNKTEGINPNLRMCYDADLVYKLEEITKLKFINKPLYYYRIHRGGVSSKNKFGQRYDNYIAKLNAFKRRLNTNVPNISIQDLYFDYYRLAFTKIIKFFMLYIEYFRIIELLNKILKKFPKISLKVKNKLKNLEKKSKPL